jgi:hypothetical protein
MCIAPVKLDDGTEVGCRECWQCRKRRVNDYVGRCIAESKFSKKTYAVTLTYDGDQGVNAVTLIYKDVQDFLKRLRKKHKCRYIVTGEYGSAKGRSHWHIILFFKDSWPEVTSNKRVDWKYWKHGFSYFQEPDWKGFEYCLKYVLKDQTSRQSDSHLAMSKKPPLGHEFFQQLAKQYVEQALVPQTYFYKFGDVRDYKNREKGFMMQGKTRENFMETFVNQWEDTYSHEPLSELVTDYYDDITEIEYTDEELYERLHYQPVKYVEPWIEGQGDGIFKDIELVEATYDGIPICYWDNKNKTGIHIVTENDEWHEKRPEVIATIKQGQQIQRRRTYAEVQYAELDEV